MRVLVITPWFPSKNAPGSGLFNLRDVELLAQEHDVTVLHLIRPEYVSDDELEYVGFHVERVPYSFERPGTIIPASRAVKNLASETELLHSMAFSALLPVRLAKPDAPWVHTEHYSQLVTPAASFRMAASLASLKRLFKYPTETVAVSQSLASVIDRYRRRPSTVIGNEVMLPERPIPNRRQEASGESPTQIRMIAVGGLIERKGPMPAVETMIELRRRGIEASLTWVGEGGLAEQVAEAAANAGCAEHLRLTGHLDPAELSTELLHADLFLLPVETETFGVAIAEALAHGLPVVTSGSGGHREFLPPAASRLVGSRSGTVLAEAVEDLISDPVLWTRQQIARYAAERFSAKARGVAYGHVYDSALAQG